MHQIYKKNKGFVSYKDLMKILVGKVLEKILVENILLLKEKSALCNPFFLSQL